MSNQFDCYDFVRLIRIFFFKNQDLRLYIQDDRFQQGIQHRTSKTVNVEGSFEETEDGVKYVRLNTHDIIRQLQSGYGAISGTGLS